METVLAIAALTGTIVCLLLLLVLFQSMRRQEMLLDAIERQTMARAQADEEPWKVKA